MCGLSQAVTSEEYMHVHLEQELSTQGKSPSDTLEGFFFHLTFRGYV